MKPEVHFWDMPRTTRFLLNCDYCKELFSSAKSNDYRSLAAQLGISYSYLHHLRKSMYSIPRDLLLKLSDISKADRNVVEKNITHIKTRSGKSIKNIFPIQTSICLSSIIGHVFGDGTICSRKRHFEYSNTNPHLIEKVEDEVNKIFGEKPFRKTRARLVYPSIIGDVLLLFGAPLAPKIHSDNTLPEWILKGPDSYKIRFLRSFFDDDGSVMLSKNYNAKGISLYQTRHESKIDSLTKLLNEVKGMLKSFDIRSGYPLISRKYSKYDGERVVMYINITEYKSIENFCNKISLTKGVKHNRLNEVISRKGGVGSEAQEGTCYGKRGPQDRSGR